MDNVFIDLGDDLQIGNGDSLTIGEDNLLSESETLVGPQGPPGPPGRDGVDGQDGQAATITVGTTTTTAPGTDAIVTNVGDEQDAILNFSIPRGAQGEQGLQGEQGETGEAGSDGFSPIVQVTETPTGYSLLITDAEGTTGANLYNGVDGQDGADGQAATITVGTTTTGAAGTNASVTNTGTSSAAIFDFVIPRGADGAPGQDGADGAPGADGQAATITVGTTTTGSAGTNASVTNSGTSSAAVLNFTIPRGADGAPGQDGADGTDGVTPSITASASVNSSTGTPAVSVTKSGTDANPNFAFAFSNLKGETGSVDWSNTRLSCTTIWSGDLHSTGSGNAVTLNEALVEGNMYIITVKGASASYLMEFPFTYRSNSYQAAYYDGSTVTRWRINFTDSGTKMHLDSASMNIGSNSGVLRIAKLTGSNIS